MARAGGRPRSGPPCTSALGISPSFMIVTHLPLRPRDHVLRPSHPPTTQSTGNQCPGREVLALRPSGLAAYASHSGPPEPVLLKEEQSRGVTCSRWCLPNPRQDWEPRFSPFGETAYCDLHTCFLAPNSNLSRSLGFFFLRGRGCFSALRLPIAHTLVLVGSRLKYGDTM